MPSGTRKVRSRYLFSGGLDSALVAWLVPVPQRVRLVSIGVEGAADLAAAREGARQMRRNVETRVRSVPVILEGYRRWQGELDPLREPARSVTLAFALATEAAPAGLVLCGQGADELFYGYAHFRGLSEDDARRRAVEDLADLETAAWPRAVRIGKAMGRTLRAPYLDPRVGAAAAAFPPPRAGEPAKAALRRAATLAGLPTSLVERPKRALQDGSGVSKVLARGLPDDRPPTE